jgi:hypothetical protein
VKGLLLGITLFCAAAMATAQDTVRAKGIDTIVTFTATDTVHYSVSKKLLRLRGAADVSYKQQRLKAEVILMDFGSSVMSAEGVRDSSGHLDGFPVFTDKGEEFVGEQIEYSFKTQRGRVRYGETNAEGGFYWGSRFNRVTTNTAFVENGCFTTCDAPHAHFYFSAPRMKAVLDDKIYMDPIVAYVEDIPVFALPFGAFFSIRSGAQSGIILPAPLVTSNRGIVLQGGGYYFAVNDYYDTEVTADITSKGGFTLYNTHHFMLKDQLTSTLRLLFGYTRLNVEDPWAMNVGVFLNHNQQLRPNESVVADLNFSTQQLFQNTSIDVSSRLTQNLRSNASYQRTFYNGLSFNMGYNRDQNLILGNRTEAPSVTFAVPSIQPLRHSASMPVWLQEMQFSYRATGSYTFSQQRSETTSPYTISENSLITHRPTLTVTPRVGFFTIAPTVNYAENWHFQSYTESVDLTDSTVVRTRVPGFVREYSYSAGVNFSTFLYGIARVNAFGLTAVRHTLQPLMSLTFRPDQSAPSDGFFGEYVSPITGKTVEYSRFAPGSGIASSSRQLLIGMNLLNRFDAKARQGDTIPDKALELLTFSINGSYNVIADSLNMSDISMSVRTPVLEGISFTAGATFSPYSMALIQDEATGRTSWRTIDRTTIAAGDGLLRLRSASVQLGTRITSGGLSFAQRTIVTDSTTKKDSTTNDLQARFLQRVNYVDQVPDLFGDRTPGYSSVVIPWDLTMDLTYSTQKPDPVTTTQSLFLALRGELSITTTLQLRAAATLDMLTGEINTPVIDITKRIHCWNLSFNWVPTGLNRGFFLRFSAAAPQLDDLQIIKQSTPIYR